MNKEKKPLTLEELIEYVLNLKRTTDIDLSTIPVLYTECVNGNYYLSQATTDMLRIVPDIQQMGDLFNLSLNTKVEEGVIIGTFPKLD